MLGVVAVGVYRQGVPKIFRAPMYRAHCAVIFAIAQLSCTLLAHNFDICQLEMRKSCFIRSHTFPPIPIYHFPIPSIPILVTDSHSMGFPFVYSLSFPFKFPIPIDRTIYTVSQKWGMHIMPHNSRKCGPVLIILLL